MTDLLVRDLDPELRRTIETMARAERRSLSDIAKRLLARGAAGYAASESPGLGTALRRLGQAMGEQSEGLADLLPAREGPGREPPFAA